MNSPHPDKALFAFRHRSGQRSLTKSAFISRIQKAAAAAGLPRIHGHSIRIGATLEYLLRGVPFDVVKVKGRWRSDAFIGYLRKHAQVLAPYMQAQPALHTTFQQLISPTTNQVRHLTPTTRESWFADASFTLLPLGYPRSPLRASHDPGRASVSRVRVARRETSLVFARLSP